MKTLLATTLVSTLFIAACATDDAIESTEQPIAACADVHIITARASTELPGEGVTGALVDSIIAASDQSITRASVSYPATLTDYASSSSQGVTALKAQLTAQVQACPNQKIVLAGYSQGAHVILDVLGGGGGGTLGSSTPPIGSSISSHVVAAISFGDPRHVIGQSFNTGTSIKNGLFPRTSTQLGVLSGFASKLRAYCDFNDTFCDSGLSTTVHLTYLSRYQTAATQWVLGKIGG